MFRKKNTQPEAAVSIIVIGNEQTGKTRLIDRLLEIDFKESYRPTNGVDFRQRTKKISNRNVLLNIREYEKRFQSIVSGFIEKANFILIVCDTTKHDALEHIQHHLDFIKSNKTRATILLVGTKVDLVAEQKVSLHQLEHYEDNKGLKYPAYLTSAKKDVGVDELVNAISHQAINNIPKKNSSGPLAYLRKHWLMIAMGFAVAGLIASSVLFSFGIVPILVGGLMIGGFAASILGLGIYSLVRHSKLENQKQHFSTSYAKFRPFINFESSSPPPHARPLVAASRVTPSFETNSTQLGLSHQERERPRYV